MSILTKRLIVWLLVDFPPNIYKVVLVAKAQWPDLISADDRSRCDISKESNIMAGEVVIRDESLLWHFISCDPDERQ